MRRPSILVHARTRKMVQSIREKTFARCRGAHEHPRINERACVFRGCVDDRPIRMDVASRPPDPPLAVYAETHEEHRSARELRDPAPRAVLEREYAAIYSKQFPIAVRFARRYVDEATAEDVVQTVFMKYWEGYTRTPALVFRADDDHTQAAILAAVRNQLRSLAKRTKTVKRNRRHVRAELRDALRVQAAPERRLGARELSTAVVNALAALPDRQREVFMLVKVDELSYEEAAKALGISTKTVHQHLARANERLREVLAEYRTRDAASYMLHDEQVVGRRREGQE